jgi:phage tail-like protein
VATALDSWRPAPVDATDLLLLNEAGVYLWLAGVIQGEGSASPALTQMRVAYERESWLRFLPAVHQRDQVNRTNLTRMLALFRSLLDDAGEVIDTLPELFDPAAAPDLPPTGWLDWLAGWLDFELDETWPGGKRRDALAEAFALHSRRGTVEGLSRLIALYTGATAHIREPARHATLWSLGEHSRLGMETQLAPAAAQGAVVGTTAVLAQSHLLEEEEYGAPLFEDVAHHFCVQVYAADFAGEGGLEAVRDVVEREKPAHMTYSLCAIEARLRVGFQARVGVDTIVGGPPAPLGLDEPQPLGFGTVLGGPPPPPAPRLGDQTKLGIGTRLE